MLLLAYARGAAEGARTPEPLLPHPASPEQRPHNWMRQGIEKDRVSVPVKKHNEIILARRLGNSPLSQATHSAFRLRPSRLLSPLGLYAEMVKYTGGQRTSRSASACESMDLYPRIELSARVNALPVLTLLLQGHLTVRCTKGLRNAAVPALDNPQGRDKDITDLHK